mgnify:CR=1 FL=1
MEGLIYALGNCRLQLNGSSILSEQVCTDPDQTVTDDYHCTCPACDSLAMSAETAQKLTEYFASHASFRRFVARGAQQIFDPTLAKSCKTPGLEGCMDVDALNYDPAASVSRPDLCAERVYGCMVRAKHTPYPTCCVEPTQA